MYAARAVLSHFVATEAVTGVLLLSVRYRYQNEYFNSERELKKRGEQRREARSGRRCAPSLGALARLRVHRSVEFGCNDTYRV